MFATLAVAAVVSVLAAVGAIPWDRARQVLGSDAASIEGTDPEPAYGIPSWYRFRQSEAAQGCGHAENLLRECVATLGVVIEKELLRASGMLPRPQEPEEE